MKSLLLAGALLSLGAASAHAQKAGAIELGVFGRYTKFDDALHFDSRVGVGGRLGIFVLPNLAIEGDASYTATASADQDFIRAMPVHARLVYNLPLGQYTALLIGGGYTRQLFRESYRETQSGAGGLLGLRLGLGEVVSIRLDATGDYIFNPESRFGPPGQLADGGEGRPQPALGRTGGALLPVRRQARRRPGQGWGEELAGSVSQHPAGRGGGRQRLLAAQGCRWRRRDRQPGSLPHHPGRHPGGCHRLPPGQ